VLKPGSDSVTSVSGAIEILKPLGLRYLEQQQDSEKAIDECGLAITSFHKLLPNYAKRYDKRFYSFHPLSYIMPVAAIPYKVEGISFGIASTNVDLSARLIKDLKIPKAIVMATENSNHDITDEYIEVGTAHLGILEDGKISTQIVKGQTPIGGNIIRHSLVQFGYDTTKNDHPIDAASVSKNEITILRDANETSPNETSPYKPGDSHHKNAEIILRTLAGTRHNPRTRAACRSAATLIYMSGKANNIEDAYQIAIETVESGKALETLKKYKQFCEKVAYKDTMETPNETLRIPRPRVSRSWSDKLNREDQKPKGTSTEKEVGR
jgi:anthranilate phosphoribosyltransferase